MPSAKYTYRLPLALLFIGLVLFANRPGRLQPYAPVFKGSICQNNSHKEGSANEYPQSRSISSPRLFSPGSTEGSGGGHVPFGQVFYSLPFYSFCIASCTKSGLRQRLRELLEYYMFQQRLSLFPKHGFW